MPTIHLVVHGRVQGVSYRKWTVTTAKEKGLSGWVRNRRNGTVEIVISGEDAALIAMQKACQTGPMLARVDKIDTSRWNEPVASGFTQLPTE